jgi:hypothetical protein
MQNEATQGFPKPPITQWSVRIVGEDGEDVGEREYVNDFKNLGKVISLAIDTGVELEAGDVVVEGRRRLNDYVGSPIWSEWERVQA